MSIVPAVRRLARSASFVVLCLPVAAMGQGMGDGSGTDNPELLSAGAPQALVVTPCQTCGEDLYLPAESGVASVVTDDPYFPAFSADWSLGLRGAYESSSISGGSFGVELTPSFSLTQDGSRTRTEITADGTLVWRPDGDLRVAALTLSGRYDYALDRLTVLSVAGNLGLTRDAPDPPGTVDGVTSSPLVFNGDGEVSVSRQFGLFDVAVRGNLARTAYGNTETSTPAVIDNSAQNYWTTGGGVRVGVELTPTVSAFVDGSASHDFFDQVSPVLLVKPDATTYSARAGLAYNWSDILIAEASIGYAIRDFDDASLIDVGSVLYGASVTYQPDSTWSVTGRLETNLTPPGTDGAGTTRIGTEASLELAYKVNSWLALRGSAGWNQAVFAGTADSQKGYSAGIGADYLVNDQLSFNADYGFSHTESTLDPVEDVHTVSIGVTLRR